MHERDLELYLGGFASGATRDNLRDQLDWLASHCTGPHVIIIGAGQGTLALLLANEGISVTMAGIETADLHALEHTLESQPDRIREAIEIIPEPGNLAAVADHSMNTAVLPGGLSSTPQSEQLVHELLRILGPRGRLLVAEDLVAARGAETGLKGIGTLLASRWRFLASDLISTDWNVGAVAVIALEAPTAASPDDRAALASGLLDLVSRSAQTTTRARRTGPDDESAPVKLFVISTGRAGSQSIADEYGLLHEPDGPYPSIEGVHERSRGQLLYGETSHFWKGQLDELIAAFPGAVYVHLVRDGREVVKSFQQRLHYRDDPTDLSFRNEILPPHTPGMGRFERLCWYWTYWNTEIEERITTRVRLEDLSLSARSNVGTSHSEWTDEEEQVFDAVCGELMGRYGYR